MSILAKIFGFFVHQTKMYVVVRNMTHGEGERHGKAKLFFWQHKGDNKENNNNFTNRRGKSIYSVLRS
jgi:hypothetical protein